jgi:HEAT repeat protein
MIRLMLFISSAIWAGMAGAGTPVEAAPPWLVQVPYEAPPKVESAPNTTVPRSTAPLGPEEIKRAEALLPLLAGQQELWAMGEFVHLGAPVVPVLVQGLKMPDERLRYNAIETLLIIKDPEAVPALLDTAGRAEEMPRIREHALRAAVRLDPKQTVDALALMAKDPESTIRKAAAFEARYVRVKSVIPILIALIPDDERFVAVTAVQSLWLLTRHDSEMHDWDISTKQDRVDWAREWQEWWKANQETFQLPEPRPSRRPL